jgi:hypothetical protein
MFSKLTERLTASESGLIALTNLLAAMIQAGRDTSQLEAAIAAVLGESAQEQKPAAGNTQVAAQQAQPVQAQAQAQNAQAVQNDGTTTGTFKVLECRESKPGVVRAYCEGPEGKVAVFAKNGNAKTLAEAVGKQVEVKYRKGDKGLIALNVNLAG